MNERPVLMKTDWNKNKKYHKNYQRYCKTQNVYAKNKKASKAAAWDSVNELFNTGDWKSHRAP